LVSDLPSWYPGSEPKPAPMPLLLVQGFVNTLDLEDGTDLLDVPATAQEWLVDAGLLDVASELSAGEVEHAKAVREAIRELIEAEGQVGDGRLEPLRQLAASHRVQLTLTDSGAIALRNSRQGGLDDGLFELLLIVHRAQQEGTWSRLKICANDECRWAFFDRSRNQQGNWCNMAVCGNRLKNRELRARRR
jgi:predicted RNA-binding Zn ribbon-like protein